LKIISLQKPKKGKLPLLEWEFTPAQVTDFYYHTALELLLVFHLTQQEKFFSEYPKAQAEIILLQQALKEALKAPDALKVLGHFQDQLKQVHDERAKQHEKLHAHASNGKPKRKASEQEEPSTVKEVKLPSPPTASTSSESDTSTPSPTLALAFLNVATAELQNLQSSD
jgi:hypothetical protein